MRRRTLLTSFLAGTAVCVLPRYASAAMATVLRTEAANQRFSVLYKDQRIGAHTVTFATETGQTRVTTEINLVVKALFFTVYAFNHRSEEIWSDERLMSLSSETVEDGETIQVKGAATPKGFRVVSKAGPFIAASGSLTSNSMWTETLVEQDLVIDAHHGGVIGVSVRKIADEQIAIAGRRIRTTRYRFITPNLAGSIWYDDSSRWVQGEFERDGALIQYRLDP